MKKFESDITYNHLDEDDQKHVRRGNFDILFFVVEEALIITLLFIMMMSL